MNEKYWDKKLSEASGAAIHFPGSKKLIDVLKQISLDQRDACERELIKRQSVHLYSDYDKETQRLVRSAEIEVKI